MRMIYAAACTIDGFIADKHGAVEWLNPFFGPDYGAADYMRDSDTLIMGRKTYENAMKLGWRGEEKKRLVVLSNSRREGPFAEVFWNRTVVALADHLREAGARTVWLMGGATAAASFLEAGLIDEMRLTIVPVILGEGIRLVGTLLKPISLRFERSQNFENGVVTIHYRK